LVQRVTTMMTKRKKNETDILETVGIKLHPSVIAELDAIAGNLTTSRSWAGRRLLLLGLERYRRDRTLIFDKEQREAEIDLPF
jgi:hypothetical protein